MTIQFWRLSAAGENNLGLACTADGLLLGRTPLIARCDERFVVREQREIERLFRRAFGDASPTLPLAALPTGDILPMNARVTLRQVPGVFGVPVVKFTLTYDGPLLSSGNKPKNDNKWAIRQHLHPQLVDLWKSHPALKSVEDNRHFPKVGGAVLTQAHHLYPGPIHPPIQAPIVGGVQIIDGGVIGEEPVPHEIIDLCESVEKHGAWFRPLVRNSYALHCGLKIRFLRQEPPGKVYQGGDLDGRLKTLVDGLTMPQHFEQVLEKKSNERRPMYCLLEDDSMISGFEVESERLLGDQHNSKEWVKLTIEVDVRVRMATIYNQSFLG